MAEKSSKKHPRSFWTFWGSAFWQGAKKSREGFGAAIELATVFLGLGLLWLVWYSKHHPNFNIANGEEFVNYWVAILPLAIGFTWFIGHVFYQPYKAYREQFDHHAKATSQ